MTSNHPTDWSEARPAVLPQPTYWPAALALANMLLLWGLLTSWIISVVGLALFILSLCGWIREIVREHAKEGAR